MRAPAGLLVLLAAAGLAAAGLTAAGTTAAVDPGQRFATVNRVVEEAMESRGVLGGSTAQLLLDPDFSMGFGVSREEGGIAIGHDGANEGYRCKFVAVPHLGEGVIVMTNSDAGDALASSVVDVVGDDLGWPWAGWSTPLWMVLPACGLVALAGLSGWLVRRRRRQRVRA